MDSFISYHIVGCRKLATNQFVTKLYPNRMKGEIMILKPFIFFAKKFKTIKYRCTLSIKKNNNNKKKSTSY